MRSLAQTMSTAGTIALVLTACGDRGPGRSEGATELHPEQEQRVGRGRYLVNVVGAGGDCHTPRLPGGAPDESRTLAGVDCFIDADPSNPDFGCLSARNLTHHETGLKNRSDAQIRDMFLKGERPADSGGKPSALHPIMPYWVLGNMRDADADAIVAYLRTVPGIDHRVAPRQAPFEQTDPVPRFPAAKIPRPDASYPDQAAALRGRYLAGELGVCLECHTPRDTVDAPLLDRAFQGGRVFTRSGLGLPPGFPELIYTSNLTPDPSGIGGWTIEEIVAALKQGKDKNQGGSPMCPPMPSGPMGAFASLTDDDARDIAHYLLSIPGAHNPVPSDCQPPPSNVAQDAGYGAR